MKMDASVFPDIEALSRAALASLLEIVRDAVSARGRFAIALAGGNTPAKLYGLWAGPEAAAATPWDRVHLFWGDERYVPADDSLSNYRMARETLISKVPIPPANVHPVPTNLSPAENAAEAYERELRTFFADLTRRSSICNFLAWGPKDTHSPSFRVLRYWKKSSGGWRPWKWRPSPPGASR